MWLLFHAPIGLLISMLRRALHRSITAPFHKVCLFGFWHSWLNSVGSQPTHKRQRGGNVVFIGSHTPRKGVAHRPLTTPYVAKLSPYAAGMRHETGHVQATHNWLTGRWS